MRFLPLARPFKSTNQPVTNQPLSSPPGPIPRALNLRVAAAAPIQGGGTDAVLEPLPPMEREPRNRICGSNFTNSTHKVEVFMNVEKPTWTDRAAPVFPGEQVFGHIEFTPKKDVTIERVEMYVVGNVMYSEMVTEKGLLRSQTLPHHLGETLFMDRVAVPVDAPDVKKNATVTLPFTFKLNAAALPFTPHTPTDILVAVFPVGTAAEWRAISAGGGGGGGEDLSFAELDARIIAEDKKRTFSRFGHSSYGAWSPANFYNRLSLSINREKGIGFAATSGALTPQFIVGSPPFPAPFYVIRQHLAMGEKQTTVLGVLAGAKRVTEDMRYVVMAEDWAAPFTQSKPGVEFTSGLCCCAKSGLVDFKLEFAHRIIYVAPRRNSSTLAPLRGAWGCEGANPVVARICASLGAVTHGAAQAKAADVTLKLKGVLHRKHVDTSSLDTNHYFGNDNETVATFGIAADPAHEGEMVMQPISIVDKEWQEDPNRGVLTPSFVSKELSMKHTLEVYIDFVLKMAVPVVCFVLLPPLLAAAFFSPFISLTHPNRHLSPAVGDEQPRGPAGVQGRN